MTNSSEGVMRTVLYNEHVALGARMVPFAGYEMPVQYPSGILSEHQWTRAKAGLFDVSHMGQAFLKAPDHDSAAKAMEALCPADFVNLKLGKQRYSQLLSPEGGILDDLMVTRLPDPKYDGILYIVVNAACKTQDYTHIEAGLAAGITLQPKDFALLALQGPEAATVLKAHVPAAADMPFMSSITTQFDEIFVQVSRSGYTGEDGFEISMHPKDAVTIWRRLVADERVKPIGLGARDSLRLEAGLCLYGHDMDATTSPVEAALSWSIQKRRREEGGFPGAARIQSELREGPKRIRVGLKPEGKLPAREGAEIESPDGNKIGVVTSGGFGPSVGAPVAMGYVAYDYAKPGTNVNLMVRGRPIAARVVTLPFVPKSFVKP